MTCALEILSAMFLANAAAIAPVMAGSVARRRTGALHRCAKGAILAEIPVGIDPDAALFDHATGLLAVMNAGDGTISLIDPVTMGQITVGGALEYAVTDGAGTLFVNIEDGNAITRVDLVSRKLLGRIALPGCEGRPAWRWSGAVRG